MPSPGRAPCTSSTLRLAPAPAGGQPLVVEAAARVPAGQIADLVRHAAGVDLLGIAFAHGTEDPSRTRRSSLRPYGRR